MNQSFLTSGSEDIFIVEDILDQFFKRLKKDMLLKGRIIRVLGEGRFILRIRGYNLVAASSRQLTLQEELRFSVLSVRPYLVLKQIVSQLKPSTGSTDILV